MLAIKATRLRLLVPARAVVCAATTSALRQQRRRAMGKRKVDPEEDVDVVTEEEEEEKPKRKRASAPKKPKFTEPFVDKLGWHVEPPSLIWRSFGEPAGSEKIAAFDLDGTLVNRKSSLQFPRDASDWKWWNKGAPKKLAELVEDGYKLVIFTNQGSIKTALDGKAKEKVEQMVELIYKDLQAKAEGEAVPLQCFMAPGMTADDTCRKPAPGMWQHMVETCNDGIKPDLAQCFFVGDADGSSVAHSDSDRKFAEAVGIAFKTPTDFFGPIEGKVGIDRTALAVAAAALETGDNPNTDLIQQLHDLSKQAAEASKASGDPKAGFKGKAYKTAAEALTLFPDKVSESNLKAVNALKGVGKGTMERIKQYLKTGSILLPGEEEEGKAAAAAGEAAGKAAKPTQEQKQAFAFM